MMSLPVEISAMLALLRAGLWEQPVSETGIFPLSGKAWGEIFSMAVRQTVTGIVARGMHHIPEDFLPERRLLARWMAEVHRIEERNIRQNMVLSELCRYFASGGLTPVLKKGQGIAIMYEKPALRECGDIDFFFRSEDEHKAACDMVSRKECRIRRMSDGSICYRWHDMDVEHHSRLLDLYSPFVKGYLQGLVEKDGFIDIEIPGTSGTTVKILSPMLNLLMLDAHVMKHAIGRGVGLRQLCDVARAYSCLHDRVDMGEWYAVVSRTGLAGWTCVLDSFLLKYLGLPSSKCMGISPDMEGADRFFEIVCRGGNFGHDMYPVREGVSVLKRKTDTLHAFCRNVGFSLRTVPKESFWIFINLLTGQIKKNF